MKNYQNSDYALNKYSESIVYRFADGSTTEVTPERYLVENPGKTEADFQAWKDFSDADYLKRDRAENAQTKKNDSIYSAGDVTDLNAPSLEERHLEMLDRETAIAAFEQIKQSDELTEIQKRRFLLYIKDGLSLRRIAEHEGVTLRAAAKSVNAGTALLKKYFKNF
jgi:predicted DNA-binding protein YlxM (UPF0122 family)